MFDGLLSSHPEIRALKTFATPGLLKVFEPYTLALEARTLLKNFRDTELFAKALQRMNEYGPMHAEAAVDGGLPLSECDEETKLRAGQDVLTTYFGLFRHPGPVILDLRLRIWELDGSFIWTPKPLIQQWENTFRNGMWDVYSGYYDDDPELLDSGLRQLGLFPVKDAFLRHFGKDASALTFSRKDFYASFESIFVRCKEEGIPIHPSFIGVGLALATMYQSLEELGGTYNVRKCFARARGLN